MDTAIFCPLLGIVLELLIHEPPDLGLLVHQIDPLVPDLESFRAVSPTLLRYSVPFLDDSIKAYTSEYLSPFTIESSI